MKYVHDDQPVYPVEFSACDIEAQRTFYDHHYQQLLGKCLSIMKIKSLQI